MMQEQEKLGACGIIIMSTKKTSWMQPASSQWHVFYKLSNPYHIIIYFLKGHICNDNLECKSECSELRISSTRLRQIKKKRQGQGLESKCRDHDKG